MKQDAPIKTLRFTRDIAALLAAATSSAVVSAIAFHYIQEMVGNLYLTLFLSAIVVLAVLFIVDFGLRQYFPYCMKMAFSGEAFKNWQNTVFFVLVMFICISQAGLSMYLSWEGRKDMVEVMMEDPTLEAASTVKAGQDATLTHLTASMTNDIKSIEGRIHAKEKQVEKQNPKSMALIMAKEDPYGWHSKNVQRKKDRATASLRVQLTEMESTKQKTISDHMTLSSTVVASTLSSNKSTMETHRYKQSRNMSYWGWFGRICTVFFMVTAILIALYETGQESKSVVSRRTKPKKVKRKKTRKSLETSIVSNDSGDWFQDDETGFRFQFNDETAQIMVDGFSPWMDRKLLKRKGQSYQRKLDTGVGNEDTNVTNIRKFSRAIQLLDDRVGDAVVEIPFSFQVA